MCVVSCPYVIYYPTVMVRYSLFVLKVPLNLKQANKQAHHLISSAIYDQFAFRPPGSTTAALIYLMYHLTNMIDQYDYVHLIALDFSKAFDTVRHSTLLHKTADLCIDDQLYNWIVHFLCAWTYLLHAG